ncbi:MAG TPA: SDR family NAD(P)-dependent oxidoreductase, partial [bacterium]|nr:SDR family NAD(P)-dependent oxidoreductase [bacterium]
MPKMKKKRTGRPLALVTGGASSLGGAISRTLAQAGYDLVLHYGRSQGAARRLRAELEAAGGRVTLLQADLGRPAALARLLRPRARDFARLSLLVN